MSFTDPGDETDEAVEYDPPYADPNSDEAQQAKAERVTRFQPMDERN